MKKRFEPARNPIAGAPVDPPCDPPTDAALLQSLRAALAAEGRVQGEGFGLAVAGGVVSVTGEISREFQRVLVDACLSAVPGVLVVENRLAVRQQGPGRRPDQDR